MKKTEQKKRPNPATLYSEEFKRQIVTEYLESDLTKREILDKIQRPNLNGQLKWLVIESIFITFALIMGVFRQTDFVPNFKTTP
jgi:hypothetical protein